MALLLKRIYESYFYVLDDLADPRANDYLLLRSPIPTLVAVLVWYKFVFKWGPEYMKDREPFDLKRIMIVYNIAQVITNGYLVYYGLLSINVVDWSCAPVDYSASYWGRKHLSLAYLYYVLKMADLIDTVFFVLRKKSGHISFLHTYHHFGMALGGWFGAKFVGGGHSYFVGFANAIVHTILYCYYLLTAYDSKYGKIIWLKKFITTAQLAQFVFLQWIFGKLLFNTDCTYPKGVSVFVIPQNTFMIILFSDFYIRTYILAPKRKKRLEEQARIEKEEQVNKQIDS